MALCCRRGFSSPRVFSSSGYSQSYSSVPRSWKKMFIYLDCNCLFVMLIVSDLTELVQFSLEKRRLRRDLINIYEHLKIVCKGGAARLFSVVLSKNRQWVQVEVWEFPSENDRTLAQIAREVAEPPFLEGLFPSKSF